MLSLLLMLLAGCATQRVKPVSAGVVPAPEQGKLAWRYYRVRFRRDGQGRTQWHLDPLVAAKIFAPMLRRYGARIPLWRFHRRSARDQAGHQFTLLAYVDDATAGLLAQALQAHALIGRLKRAGAVRDLVLTLAPSERRGRLGGSSDPAWSDGLKRAWPYFIMGVSQTWLALVQAQGAPPAGADTQALIEHYRSVQDKVTRLWNKEGGHAFLHHLNAVFGYEPLKVQLLERGEVRF